MTSNDPKILERPERVISHALVEVRRHRWWPFGIQSAVLLDLSTQGFKIEFTGHGSYRQGDRLWMTIPLSPFQVLGPESITLKINIKWFDANKMRIGGVFEFTETTSPETGFLEQIIDKVKAREL